MGKVVVNKGDKFGRWTIMEEVDKIQYPSGITIRRFLCKCDCGTERIVLYDYLANGRSKSCGCLQREIVSDIRKFPRQIVNSRLYAIWNGIKCRCYTKSSFPYTQYGAKGITMCDEWKNDYMAFYDWSMANGYSDDLTIDRIDYKGNYEPSNCRWVTPKEQANNKSSNVRITFNCESHTLSEWCDIVGIKQATLSNRLNKAHWSIEKALTTPVQTRKRI